MQHSTDSSPESGAKKPFPPEKSVGKNKADLGLPSPDTGKLPTRCCFCFGLGRSQVAESRCLSCCHCLHRGWDPPTSHLDHGSAASTLFHWFY